MDVYEPFYLGPATVLNVADHLLFIHFDGWSRKKEESFQWVSAWSGDIYPAGWAEMVGHRFMGHVERPLRYDSFYLENDKSASNNAISAANDENVSISSDAILPINHESASSDAILT